MNNIINLKFDNNPEPGDYIEFNYDTNGEGDYQLIRLIFIPDGNRFITGEFEIQQTVGDTVEAFIEFFMNDFPIKVNGIDLFDIKVDQGIVVRIENTLGGLSDLLVYSPLGNIDGELTSNIIEGVNEITLIFSDRPSDGDELGFQYYPDYPDSSNISAINLKFVSGSPSNTGEIPIGSNLNDTYENILEWFGRYYNDTGKFDIYLDEDSITSDYTYLSIRSSNSSTFKNIVSTIDPADVVIEEVSRPILEQRIISDFILVKSPKMVYNTSGSNYKRFRFSLRLLTNPSVDSSFMFNLKQNGINKIIYLKYFRISGSGNSDIVIGTNINDTMSNLYDNLVQYNSSDLVQYELNNNIIYIDIYDGDENEYSIEMIDNTANIEYYGPVVDGGVRGYDHTIFNVGEWEGMISQFMVYDDTIKWVIDKPLISEDQFQTYINVSPLIDNRLKSNLSVYLSSSNVLPLPQGSSKWVRVSAMNKLIDLDRDFVARTYYALDGWSEDGSNSVPRILLVGGEYGVEYDKPVRYIRRSLHRGSVGRIHYQTTLHDGLVDVFGKHSSRTIENTGGNPLNSREYIKSVRIPFTDYLDQPFVQTITMVFGYSKERFPTGDRPIDGENRPIEDLTVETTKVIIDIIDECKYPVVEVVFKNRYGVLETLTFGKVSKRELKTTREDFSSSVVDINGVPNLNTHNKKPFNINGQEEYTLNTGHVKEYMNEVYTDLFMSDEIYLKCEAIDRFVPVNLMDNDFNRMKRINVGLINYTFRFQTSYNKNYNYS